MRSLLYMPCLGLVLVLGLAPAPASAESPPAGAQSGILDKAGIPQEILDLLDETRKAYGPDAVLLQLQLLHHAIHAESILPASVQVAGIKEDQARRYLRFAVETGVVFNTQRVDRRRRVSRLWSGVVIPALDRLDSYEMPGDGIAVELKYFHRPYADPDELADTVRDDPGNGEGVAFYMPYSDILGFRRRELDASQLYSRTRARLDDVPFPEPLLSDP